MAPFVLAAAAFWTLSYLVIVGGLAAVESRVRSGTEGSLSAAAPYAGLALLGVACLVVGPRLLAGAGPAPLPHRIAWNGTCAIWVIFEWSLLVHLLGLIDAASSRFLARATFRIPSGLHLAGYLVVAAATVLFHRELLRETSAPPDLLRGCHLFVRLCGFVYLTLEAAICLALLRARSVLGALLALA